jgi:hypothetical protein
MPQDEPETRRVQAPPRTGDDFQRRGGPLFTITEFSDFGSHTIERIIHSESSTTNASFAGCRRGSSGVRGCQRLLGRNTKGPVRIPLIKDLDRAMMKVEGCRKSQVVALSSNGQLKRTLALKTLLLSAGSMLWAEWVRQS